MFQRLQKERVELRDREAPPYISQHRAIGLVVGASSWVVHWDWFSQPRVAPLLGQGLGSFVSPNSDWDCILVGIG